MKDRVADLHRRSSKLPDKGSPDPERYSRKDRGGFISRVPWAFLTFAVVVAFGAWRFIPPGYLPASMTYATVMGRLEGSIQGEATRASMNETAAAEGAKAKATAPIAVEQAAGIANATAPIQIIADQTMAANKARIALVQSCRQTMMSAAGQAYAACVGGGYEAGAECDAKRDLILERYPDCGTLPGEPANQTAPASSTGETP